MSQPTTTGQQPWDYREFVRCYNLIAEENGGYHFREEIANPEDLGIEYASMGSPTLHDYALSTFQLDQQY